MNIPEATHQSSFKGNPINGENSRVRRRESNIELRKSKKQDQLFKSRNISEMDATSPMMETNDCEPHLDTSIEEIVEAMNSNNEERQLFGTKEARKILSKEHNPPIDAMIPMLPIFVRFLGNSNDEELQYEAAWAVTNITSGTSEQTRCVIDANAVPLFIQLLESESIDIAEQAAWALANIAGDNGDARNIVIQHKVVDALLNLLQKDITKLSFQRNIAWLMSNLCRRYRSNVPPFEEIKHLLPVLSGLLVWNDAKVLAHICWSFSYITDDESYKIDAVIAAGALPHLVKLLGTDEHSILVPAIRSVGNIVAGTKQQTDVAIAAGVLPQLKLLLQHPKNDILKEAAWAVSNIAAGTHQQIQYLIDLDLFTGIRRILETGDFKSQKEAAWAVMNVAESGTPQQLMILIEEFNIMKPFCKLLDAKDADNVNMVLDGLSTIFELSKEFDRIEQMLAMFEEMGGLKNLEGLQMHENEEVYAKAFSILDEYFSGDNDVEADPEPDELDGGFNF